MLRRQSTASASIVEDPPAAAGTTFPPNFAPAFPPTDRRRTERRGMDSLRAEALKTIVTMVEDRNFGGLRDRVSWTRNIRPSRIILLVVALVAGGVAAWLALQTEAAPPPAPASVEVAMPAPQVLVAATNVGAGHKLTADALVWQDWPEAGIRPEYVLSSATPDAITDIAGSIARSEILAGEPIRAEKLVPAGGGFLSSILEPGMRAVSVSVAADSASGGFVSPGDRVDVVLTRTLVSGQDSQIILRNVRVMAINAELGDTAAPDAAPASAAFANTAIATLELDPTEAEVIINATSIGKLTLMLRPVSDAPASERADTAANAAIRLSSPFWTNAPPR